MSLRPARPSLRSLLLAPVRLRTYGNLCFLALAAPFGMAYFLVVVTGLSLSVPLSLLLVGVPLLLATLLAVRGLAAVERWLARRLLGAAVPSPSHAFLSGSPRERVEGLVFDRRTWLECGYLLAKLPIGVSAFALLSTTLTVSVTLLATPLLYDRPGARVGFFPAAPVTISPSVTVPWGDLLVGVGVATRLSEWVVDSPADALVLSAVGLAVLLVSLNLLNGAAWLLARLAQLSLDDGRALARLR